MNTSLAYTTFFQDPVMKIATSIGIGRYESLLRRAVIMSKKVIGNIQIEYEELDSDLSDSYSSDSD